jgi:hypothetical protein
VDKDEQNFVTEKARCQETTARLAAQMLRTAYQDNGRVAQCMGPREFGKAWMSQNIAPRDLVFEHEVLNLFLQMVEG